ncbi:hypothetical protein [Nocardioides massiliensis]|uniref:HNH endonuclease n=1 Tax=Nocardioides massiliensis TaxID=1325935 RepID=A0ABT9NJ67_9ACTN|nr:hypothetical protein [Nocardioides massiliensis]MDP9820463.1 hypothetical protein [Nocardioides massiliensis]
MTHRETLALIRAQNELETAMLALGKGDIDKAGTAIAAAVRHIDTLIGD